MIILATDRGKGGTKLQLIFLALGTYFLCYILIFDPLNHFVCSIISVFKRNRPMIVCSSVFSQDIFILGLEMGIKIWIWKNK